MNPARLCLLCLALAAGLPTAAAQTLTRPSLSALLHTGRLLHAGDRGQGVRVGVISDGAAFYTTLRQQGVLPQVAFYGATSTRGDEGDWMLQIVHRLAPRAALAFCPGGPSGQTLACARLLVGRFHADIIVDDTNPQPVYAFPNDKAVGYAELARQHPDVLFFTGAGNNGVGYYQGPWTPTPLVLHYVSYEAQDFGASLGEPGSPYEQLEVPAGATAEIVLGTTADPNDRPRCAGNPEVTLALLDSFNTVVQSAHGRCPVLGLKDRQPAGRAGSLRIAVLLPPQAAPADFKLKLVALRLDGSAVAPLPLEYHTAGGAGNSATAPGLIAVAAVDPNTGWHRRFLVETFANTGPQCLDYARSGTRLTRLSSPRCLQQPAFVAPDQIPVVMRESGEERFMPFTGDSAAGPAAAGVSALLLSARVPARKVIGLLEQTAVPQGSDGWSAQYGYGLIDADAAAVSAGVLPAAGDRPAIPQNIPPFRLTAAYLQDQQLVQQARDGDRAAFLQLQRGAQSGDADAQTWLAHFELDLGNQALAAHWAQLAANAGAPAAQNLLASLYARGWGVPRDERAAQAWWWRAARAGLGPALFHLGVALSGIGGTPANPVLSYALMRTAAARGSRFPNMARVLAGQRLRMTFTQIGAAERLMQRFASDPDSIPPP